MRGLDENIWSVFACASTARLTAVQHPPVVPRWTPMRFLFEAAAPIYPSVIDPPSSIIAVPGNNTSHVDGTRYA